MKRLSIAIFIISIGISCLAQDFSGKSVALFQFSLDFGIQNDQGEMNTKDYLKEYGTKGKTRAVEYMSKIMLPFITAELGKKNIVLLPCEDLANIKANAYGIPSMTLNKAQKSCEKADYFLKIAIKDITVINPDAQQTNLSIKMRTITTRCRISLYDKDKNPVKELEGLFNSGQAIDASRNIGIDPRKITGPEREQELKVYESSCKMAFLLAMDKW